MTRAECAAYLNLDPNGERYWPLGVLDRLIALRERAGHAQFLKEIIDFMTPPYSVRAACGAAKPTIDRSALDQAVRRFPVVVKRARAYWPMLCSRLDVRIDCVASPDEVAAIRREYRLILAERAKLKEMV